MKRNTIETGLAFVGLGMIYYGASVKQCLHAAGQPAPNCHFTPLGDTFFLVGMVVAWIGIAPWKIYARNYLCQVCGAAFGGGKGGKLSQSSHLQSTHPDFYKWDVRWIRWTNVFAIFCFVYIIGTGELVGAMPSLSAFNDLWLLGFVGVMAALVFDLADLHFVTKKFKNKWLLLHPEEKNAETLRIEPEKLVAGVAAWNKFTRGQEQYSGGLMSGGLKKKGNFAGGYGVYFTSQRIIGVKTSRWFVVILVVAALAGIAGASAVAIIVGTSAVYSYFIAVPIILALIAWGQNRLRFQDPMTLEELDRRKDFEIRRENISGVDLKKPGIVRRGHLIITSKRGKDLTVMINQEPGVFERLKGLVSGFAFVPSETWIKERSHTINYPTPIYTYPGKLDSIQDDSAEIQRIVDEKHVEQRDFELCPHCAAMVPRGTGVCPSCGKTIGS